MSNGVLKKRWPAAPAPMQWLRGPAWIDPPAVVLDAARATTYQPLAEPLIGLELARVRTNDEVVAFVHRFGLLQVTPAGRPQGAPLRESLDVFLRIAIEVGELFEAAIVLQQATRGDKAALSALRAAVVVPDDEMYPFRQEKDGTWTERRAAEIWSPEERYVGADDRTILIAASEQIARQVNEALSGEDSGLQFLDRAAMGEDAPPGKWRMGMMPSTLAGACYLSVALTLVDQEPIGICAEPSCRRVFFIKDGRQRFCTATCANRARFKRYKDRHGGTGRASKEGV